MRDVEAAAAVWTAWYLGRQPIDPLDALAANAEAVQLMVGRRWLAMRRAREAGHSWHAIATALGIDDEQHARDVYLAAVERQEHWCPEMLDGCERNALA